MTKPATDNVITYENAHKLIIDRLTFERVQDKINVNQLKLDKRNHRNYPLTTLVKCTKCGHFHSFFIRTDRIVQEGTYSMKPCSNRDYLTGQIITLIHQI